MSDFIIEKDWITESGLRAVAVIVRNSHRCGYVGVGGGHPLYGVGYDDPCELLSPLPLEEPLGKRSSLTVFFYNPEESPSPMVFFDVHGSLTYSGNRTGKYPVPSDLWWFGFDCAHAGDAYLPEYYEELNRLGGSYVFAPHESEVVRSLDYVEEECESLAEQLHRVSL